MSRQSDTRDVAHPSVRKASPSLQKGIRPTKGMEDVMIRTAQKLLARLPIRCVKHGAMNKNWDKANR